MTDPRVLQALADLKDRTMTANEEREIHALGAYVFWDRWKASIWLERLAAIRKALT